MKRSYYVTPRSTPIMRFLWKSAGADRFILERATYSDQVKYMCLGGIIVATGVMAALAGGYAFYTIFGPRGSALDSGSSIGTSIGSVIFGILWGLMIFNLDRFIVSSTGKGDGTEAITWGEFKGAIPRIIMGAIIALTISKPVEIRMFKTEIDVELYRAQQQKELEQKKLIEERYTDLIGSEQSKINVWKEEINAKENRLVELQNQLTDEMGGRSGAAGYGPEAKKIEGLIERQQSELEKLKKKNDPLIDKSFERLEKYESDKIIELENSGQIAAGLDGLLERIKLSHKIAGTTISLFTTLLFMAIELTPIFFKLMLIKSPYDFLKDNIEELMKADEGIRVQYNYYKDKEGQQRDLITYLNRDKMILEKSALQKAQEELTDYAIEKYKSEMKAKIDKNPEEFIHVEKSS